MNQIVLTILFTVVGLRHVRELGVDQTLLVPKIEAPHS